MYETLLPNKLVSTHGFWKVCFSISYIFWMPLSVP